jgi:hypothetical protein
MGVIGDDPPSADAVAAAFIESFGRHARSLDGGWVRQLPEGVTAVVSGVPAATLNGVWSAGAGCDVESLQAAVELVAQNGLPFCLQVRPRDEHVAARVARGQTMVVAPPIPLMALAGPPAAPAVDTELAIRPLEPREAAMHVQVAARAFGATAELFGLAVTETSLRSPGVRAYLGDRAGRPVATAIAATHAGRVGLYNVATLPDARRPRPRLRRRHHRPRHHRRPPRRRDLELAPIGPRGRPPLRAPRLPPPGALALLAR